MDWRTLGKAQLDAQYITRGLVPEWATFLQRWDSGSAACREACRRSHGELLDLAYGPHPKQKLDVFVPARPHASRPVQVVFHGGYWRALDKDGFAIAGVPAIEHGVLTVQVNYGLCPDVSMSELVEHCRLATEWVAANCESHGGDPHNIWISGHSAGGHLSALMLATDWAARGAPALTVRGICSLSGLYDLAPFPHSSFQDDLRLTQDEVRTLSPALLPVPAGRRVLLTVGSLEPAEFHRQAADYEAQCRASGARVEKTVLEGTHHYSMVDAFSDPAHPLARRWLETMLDED